MKAKGPGAPKGKTRHKRGGHGGTIIITREPTRAAGIESAGGKKLGEIF